MSQQDQHHEMLDVDPESSGGAADDSAAGHPAPPAADGSTSDGGGEQTPAPEANGHGSAHAESPEADSEIGDVGASETAEDNDAAATEGELSVEGLVADLERVTFERDQYLEASRRIQAEFENYRKQVGKRETEARERANEGLVGEMLPVLDAFDGALSSGVEDVAPMRSALLDALAKQGLERIDPVDDPFDPNLHEAVMHDEGDGDQAGPVVAEVMRAGYSWKGRVVRPAMVRVRG